MSKHEWKHVNENSYCYICGEHLNIDDSNWDSECPGEEEGGKL